MLFLLDSSIKAESGILNNFISECSTEPYFLVYSSEWISTIVSFSELLFSIATSTVLTTTRNQIKLPLSLLPIN